MITLRAAKITSAVASGVVGGAISSLVSGDVMLGLVLAPFSAVLGGMMIGDALFGSTQHMSDDRAPLSPRSRSIWGGIGALIVIAFSIVVPILHARGAR